MKTTLALLMASLMLVSAASAAGISDIGKIARAKDVPGKFQPGKCEVFATSLAKRLNAAGIQARVIVYSWQRPDPDGGAKVGRHAAVVYQDGDRTYVMDNMTGSPKWVSSHSAMDIAQTFSGPGAYVASAQEVSPDTMVALQ